MTPTYQAFFQYLLKKRMADSDSVAQDLNIENLEHAIDTINNNIGEYQLQIENQRCQLTGKKYTILCFTGADLENPLHILNAIQEEYIYKVIDGIVNCNNGLLPSIQAENLRMSLVGGAMAATQAYSNLDLFVQNNLLVLDNAGNYTLSPLTASQLKVYIQNTYSSLEKCFLCNEVCIVNIRCESCQIAVHKYCYEDSLQIGITRCRNCKTQWA